MIPRANITAWRHSAPWPDNAQVEQDLALSRALVEMFSREAVAEQIVFRGGTALHKLYFDPPARYSEDIDLVQRDAGPIGPLVAGIRDALDSWLGEPKWRAGHGRFTLYYRFETTFEPIVKMRLKVEINTREHFAVHGIVRRSHRVENPWFSGAAEVHTFSLSELLATKLRALHQRKKGRDLFDLALGLAHAEASPEQIISAFERYMDFGGTSVTRAQFEASMASKLADEAFLEDVTQLLRTGLKHDPTEAWELVSGALVSRLPGEPWKGEDR
ncbi:MAG: nucleotidyl transferase AbiEii/AbiGii toxin family protein [Acidobacteria bacterium]|nr:nucleotidyl transferase AbiEii/AbiGii toxin family protein [Acidobacteriota bacterium]